MSSNLHEPRRMREAGDFTIGVFGILALLLLAGAWFWYKHEPWNRIPQRFNVSFSDVDGLNDNAAVRINGVIVGAVERIKLTAPNTVQVGVKINDEVVIPEGASFEIASDGLIGAKILKIVLPNGSGNAKPLTADITVPGKDPDHPERRLYALAENLSRVKFDQIDRDLRDSTHKLAVAADEAAALARNMRPAISSAHLAFDDARLAARQASVAARHAGIAATGINSLAGHLSSTSKSVNSLLNDPAFHTDVKQISTAAADLSQRIQNSLDTVDGALANESLRKDALGALEKIRQSTDNVRATVLSIEKVASDPSVRSDILRITAEAGKLLTDAGELLGDTSFGTDIGCTMAKVRTAADRIDQVGLQLHQILDKRAAGLQLMVGRPGHVKYPPARQPQCLPTGKVSTRYQTPLKRMDKVGFKAISKCDNDRRGNP